jgi:transposase
MIRQLYQQGHSISAIARRLKLDRKTVRKALHSDGLPRYGPRAPRLSILETYKPYLKSRLAQGIQNAHRLYHEIRSQGYAGGYTIVKDFVRPLRPLVHDDELTVRFETEPARQAQVDFGEFRAIDLGGTFHRFYLFLYTLGYSRAMYGLFVSSCAIDIFLECHIQAFSYLGGVPLEGLYDNCKQVVLERDAAGHVRFHPRFLDFAAHYGLMPRLCQPGRPQTKGKIERNIGYVRDAFFKGRSFEDLADLNRQFHRWLEEVANVRLHGTTRQRPIDRLKDEPLVSLEHFPPYPIFSVFYRRVSRDCLIAYKGNFYSIPPDYAGKVLAVRHAPLAEHLDLYAQDQKIATHVLCAGKGQHIIDPAHHIALWQRLRHRQSAENQGVARLLQGGDGPCVEQRSLEVYARLCEQGGTP